MQQKHHTIHGSGGRQTLANDPPLSLPGPFSSLHPAAVPRNRSVVHPPPTPPPAGWWDDTMVDIGSCGVPLPRLLSFPLRPHYPVPVLPPLRGKREKQWLDPTPMRKEDQPPSVPFVLDQRGQEDARCSCSSAGVWLKTGSNA